MVAMLEVGDGTLVNEATSQEIAHNKRQRRLAAGGGSFQTLQAYLSAVMLCEMRGKSDVYR